MHLCDGLGDVMQLVECCATLLIPKPRLSSHHRGIRGADAVRTRLSEFRAAMATAAVTDATLAASGYATNPHHYEGFLPPLGKQLATLYRGPADGPITAAELEGASDE